MIDVSLNQTKPKQSSVTEASPSDCQMSYPRWLLGRALPLYRDTVSVLLNPSRLGQEIFVEKSFLFKKAFKIIKIYKFITFFLLSIFRLEPQKIKSVMEDFQNLAHFHIKSWIKFFSLSNFLYHWSFSRLQSSCYFFLEIQNAFFLGDYKWISE